jgi:ABC-type branched-subunit amino acid transport system permease subunit
MFEKLFGMFIGAILIVVGITVFLPEILKAISWLMLFVFGLICLIIMIRIAVRLLRRNRRPDIHYHYYNRQP